VAPARRLNWQRNPANATNAELAVHWLSEFSLRENGASHRRTSLRFIADVPPTGLCQKLFEAFGTPTAKQRGQRKRHAPKSRNKREIRHSVHLGTPTATPNLKKPKK
jgi:hypothetical protein